MIRYEDLKKVNEPFMPELRSSFEVTLASGRYVLGTAVETFEREFASYCGVRHCVGVASGLDALVLSLKALDLPKDSEVIVPSNSYIATVLAVVHAGFRPVLVEPDIRTYGIDPGKIEERLSRNTAAIVAVHLYGKICAMDPIIEIADKHGLRIVEDCAQAHGARYRERKAGSFGHCAAFSFYPTKNLGALGDGGAVVTDDAGTADRMRMLRNYGSSSKNRHDLAGYNTRLDEMQAGFLSVKLKHLDGINEHKRRLAQMYRDHLREGFTLPAADDESYAVYHIFNIRHHERDRLREHLFSKGIGTEIHYPVPPHRQRAMQGIIPPGDYRISEEIHATTLSLPISFHHTGGDVLRVVEALNDFGQARNAGLRNQFPQRTQA